MSYLRNHKRITACSMRRVFLVVCLLAAPPLGFGQVPGDEPKPKEPAAAVELVVDPAAEPIPALKYRLLPPPESLRPGNAAPIYLRITYETSEDWRRQFYDEPARLLQLPRGQLPLGEVGRLLRGFSDEIEQMTAASYRSDCDWQYVTENRDPMYVMLPDAQSMRTFGRLLVLKARYEIQSGDLSAAIGTLRDGVALSQHVARAPFLVNQLIGNALAGMLFLEVEAFIAQPGAVNLYWALATLPRPFISYRNGLATERQFLVMKFPELADLDRPCSDGQWQRILSAMRKWTGEVMEVERSAQTLPDKSTPDQIEMARRYLREDLLLPADEVQAMSSAEVEVRYMVALYAEIIEAWQKWCSAPIVDSVSRASQLVDSLRDEARRRELFPLVSTLAPVGANVLRARSKTARVVARLEAIEALRMHAAATGNLPVTLAEVTIVPVPNDPATGAPFRYRRDADGAVLDVTDELGDSRDILRMPVRIRLRDK